MRVHSDDSPVPPSEDRTLDRCSGIENMRLLSRHVREVGPSFRESLLGLGAPPTVTGTPFHPPVRRTSVRRMIGLVVATALVAASGTALGMRALSAARSEPSPRPDAARSSTSASAPADRRQRAPSSPPPAEHDVAPAPPHAPVSGPDSGTGDDTDGAPRTRPTSTSPKRTTEPALSERRGQAPEPVHSEPRTPPRSPSREARDETSKPPSDETATVVDQALAGRREEHAAEPDLPSVPDRTRVASRLRDVGDALQQCTDDSGVARARLVIEGPTGRVRHAEMVGDFAGTEAGSCIATTLREKVRLPRFAREKFEITFPYVL